MRRTLAIGVPMVLAVLGLTVSVASSDEPPPPPHFSTSLSGFNEAPPILSNGTATFSATVQGNSLTYTLIFSGLFNVTQAHLHFAQSGVPGGVFLFLCSNLGNGPAGTPACPTSAGTVTRTVTGADIIAPPGQGVTAGSFADALRILNSGEAYANVHTQAHGGGEIRGQLNSGDD